MDGTLIGNKHIVAVSVNCIEGGRACQRAKVLVPVGLLEVQEESTEILRKTLPREFLDSIRNVKQIRLNGKDVDIKVKLGGDFMNAVYVFGLAGVSSNYPCVFCTQHKDHLHVTEPGQLVREQYFTGTRKKKEARERLVPVDPTSYHDISRKARNLVELEDCLKSDKKNDLGISSAAKTAVDKFKDRLKVLKEEKSKRKKVLEVLSKEFVNGLTESGLRSKITPYMHIIGNHLFQFDELEDLGAFDMQGVEKGNDLLSRLYFSSSNPAKTPLKTMMLHLYRLLEMNFENPRERDAIARFAETKVYDLDENEVFFSSDDLQDQFDRNSLYMQSDLAESSETENPEEPGDIEDNFSEEQEIGCSLKYSYVIPKRTEKRFKSFRSTQTQSHD
ncbi:unnamed protein product [Didymodactylos carnosus]|uniref:Uncharacterized protein n=1 Tax=Didymodactylos carnosus TaxID=1234261 RepID=A0A814YRE2_9BILA|nr:unnamed protein product [Didymodactylos carnosus]CAF1234580.1 unnamed protein product [Didymodactylos carnosus]CAF3911493.1 unnamed protein product [Didymodactylos carnosus]CAF3997110.1 unnamed protein product [Didymodactylos carnosus]